MELNDCKIRKTIQTYIDGYLNADKNLIGQVFHDETQLYNVNEDSIGKMGMAEWHLNLDDRKAREDIRQAFSEIKFVDITNDTAVVKLILQFEKIQFTDYLSLLCIKNEWIIVGKIYSVLILNQFSS